MKIYRLSYVSVIILLLSGCSLSSLITEKSSSNAKADAITVNTSAANEDEPDINVNALLINQDLTFQLGQGSSYFAYTDNTPVKISFSNTGTKSFIFKIKNVEQGITITEGILKGNESFEQVYEDLPLGDYIISYVVENEIKPLELKLTLKVELLPN